MEQVTLKNLDALLDRYANARGGELNELTHSEAMFVFRSKFGGAYILNTGLGIVWIGLQNASARWSNNGKPFPSVRAALLDVLENDSPSHSVEAGAFYSEDSVVRLRWLADQVEQYKADTSTLVHMDV